MTTPLFYITLRHPNGESRYVPVEYVTEKCVTVRWDLAGLFDIQLNDGSMKARDAKSQRRGKAKWYKKYGNEWKADVEDVRLKAKIQLGHDEREKAARLAAERHTESMPGANPRIGGSQ